jgi:hypothetical protein
MDRFLEDDEIPLPLLRPISPRPAEPQEVVDESPEADRLRPAASGALCGLAAGAIALGVGQAMLPWSMERALAHAASLYALSHDLVLALAYGSAAAAGAIVGAVFAGVTRYLRRWPALAIWALVVFESIAVLVLAAWPARLAAFAPATLAGTAAYALLASLALPIRRR